LTARNQLNESVFVEDALENLVLREPPSLESAPKAPLLDKQLPAEPAQPAHFFLLRQPEVLGSQTAQRLGPVYTRIAAAGVLKPLTAQETRNYVERELRAQGWRNDPEIDPPVFYIIHQSSRGVPERINTICNRLLLECFVEQRHRITVADASALVKESTVETSLTRRPSSEELSSPPREALSEGEVGEEPVLKCPSVELFRPAPQLPSDPPLSPRQKAHFESRNVSPTKGRARRGNW
jgi:hypothetical protein